MSQPPINVPFPSGSGVAAPVPDWAAHANAVTVAADWTSASAYGAATGVYKEDRTTGVRMRTDKAVDGATDTNGDRVQGLLQGVAGGDFTVGLRFAFHRPGVAVGTTSTAIAAAVVFVDGVDVDTSSWYGAGNYYSAVGIVGPSVLRLDNEAGGSRFETYGAFGNILNAPGVGAGPYDAWLVRSGTTLTMYMGTAAGAPAAVYSWTVTAGAGLIGLRIQHQIGVDHDLMATILAYRTDLAGVPW